MSSVLAPEVSLVAHGGVGGAFVEVGLVVVILFVFVAVWLRERRATKRGEAGAARTDEDLFRDEETR